MVVDGERIHVGTVHDMDDKIMLPRALPDGRVLVVVALEDGGFAAFEGHCPHRGGPLAAGRVRGEAVICPWHGFAFHMRSGDVVGAQSIMRLSVFPVSVEAEQIFVTIPKQG